MYGSFAAQLLKANRTARWGECDREGEGVVERGPSRVTRRLAIVSFSVFKYAQTIRGCAHKHNAHNETRSEESEDQNQNQKPNPAAQRRINCRLKSV